MKPAEALLPGTDALPSATVEIATYRGKILARHRDRAGITKRQTFNDKDEAMQHFWKCADQLKKESNQ